MSEKQSLYLKRFVLEDYRSIRHAAIDFMPGLNIIIGKNGSGKTSFLKAVDESLLWNVGGDLVYATLKSELLGSKKYVFISRPQQNEIDKVTAQRRFFLDEEEVTNKINNDIDFDSFIFGQEQRFFIHEVITHGTPDELVALTDTFSNRILLRDKGKIAASEIMRLLNHQFSQIVLALRSYVLQHSNVYNEAIPLSAFISSFNTAILNLVLALKQKLALVTSISDVRVSEGLSFSNDLETANEFSLNNLIIEFYSEGQWHRFDELSDGTKRLVYLVTKMLFEIDDEKALGNSHANYIVLIEEPELGIHPHQLHQLMTFIKEESEDKQIILTTHSPQVLNVLGVDDFDRIIICEYDSEKGTQLRHMTDQEKKEAAIYMEEVGFFSDYWLHSDFNRI